MPVTSMACSQGPVEIEPVREWRPEQLEATGYPRRDASMVSGRGEVDLQLAVRLLLAGCPVETALRILL